MSDFYPNDPYLSTLAQVFPIAAVTYLPGQRDATQHGKVAELGSAQF